MSRTIYERYIAACMYLGMEPTLKWSNDNEDDYQRMSSEMLPIDIWDLLVNREDECND